MTISTTGKKKKEFLKSSFEIIERATKQLQLSDQEISKALGFTGGAVSKWRRDGKIPRVVGLAVEGILRRQGNPEKLITLEDSKILILRFSSNADFTALEPLIERFKGVKVLFKG